MYPPPDTTTPWLAVASFSAVPPPEPVTVTPPPAPKLRMAAPSTWTPELPVDPPVPPVPVTVTAPYPLDASISPPRFANTPML